MEKKNIYILAGLAAIVLLWYYWTRRNTGMTQALPPGNDFAAPYTDWPNGIYPSPSNMNGNSSAFQPINVTVNVPQFGQLGTQYMPTFGFVGVTAMGE